MAKTALPTSFGSAVIASARALRSSNRPARRNHTPPKPTDNFGPSSPSSVEVSNLLASILGGSGSAWESRAERRSLRSSSRAQIVNGWIMTRSPRNPSVYPSLKVNGVGPKDSVGTANCTLSLGTRIRSFEPHCRHQEETPGYIRSCRIDRIRDCCFVTFVLSSIQYQVPNPARWNHSSWSSRRSVRKTSMI